jgi:hypothetical protein
LKIKKVERNLYYTGRITTLNESLKKAQKIYQFYSFLRLIFFLLSVTSIFVFWNSGYMILGLIITFSMFLVAVSLSVDAKYQRDKLLILIEINRNEIDVSKGDWSMFDEGNEFKDSKHPFSFDLDIFGEKSIFQLINRTVSFEGKNKLASILQNGTSSITLNNKAINELSSNIKWCQEFMSEGIVSKKEKGYPKSLGNLKDFEIMIPKGLNFFRISLPIIAISTTILYTNDIINGFVFSFIFSLIMLPLMLFLKNTNSMTLRVSDQSSRVRIILKQLELFRDLEIKDPEFKAKQSEFFKSNESVLASIKQFEKIIKRFEFRLNLFVGVLLNFFLSWDFQMIYQLNNWLKDNKDKLVGWEDNLADIEVWISGAIFKFNHKNSTFTAFNDENYIDIEGISHPFIDSKKKIANNVIIKNDQNFLIITGPNMAGKSTYLRSLGLAFLFSNAGFPVLADSCSIPHLKLFTSMRTSDDLTSESSYFHAELIRLRFIMDAIESGEKVFIILDEILKGTNSKDKEIGSTKFLQKLVKLNAKGVIATHDLSLCKLSTDSIHFKNMFFDSTIENDELYFSYQINEGICQNMNASFLLSKMKLVD